MITTKRLALWRVVAGLALLATLPATVSPKMAVAEASAPDARSNRITVGGGEYFLSGVNYPFYRYYGGDIATLATRDGDGNVATESSFDAEAIDKDFATMHAGGVNTVRWFLFGDGRGGPEFDASGGKATGLDATFYSNMEQALEIAARHDIHIIWSVWDFLAFEQANWLCGGNINSAISKAAELPPGAREQYEMHLRLAAHKEAFGSDKQLKDLPHSDSADSVDGGQVCFPYAGGHRNMVLDTTAGGAQDAFFNNAMIPLLQHFANNDSIVGWEIMNEPEWTINDVPRMGQYPTVREPVAVAPMRAFFARFTQAVHQYAPGQLATVGSASLKWMGAEPNFAENNVNLWQGLGFDYYGVHYYGWMQSKYNHYSPLERNYNTDPDMLRLDAPVVVGEFPINGGSAPVYLPNIRRQGTESSTLNLRYICNNYIGGRYQLCTRPYTATIEYYNPAGHLDITQNVTLQPGSNWTGTAPVQSGDWTGAARIISNGPIAAQVTQENISNAAEAVTYLGEDRGSNNLYLPFVLNVSGHHRTRIALQNTTVSTATVSINYYDGDGVLTATDANITLAPRGMTLLDPDFPAISAIKRVSGAPVGFQGSAVVQSDRALVGVAYELNPTGGSDAYAAVPEAYDTILNLPSVRNWVDDGAPTIMLQNARSNAATATVTYYTLAGVVQATDSVTLPPYGSLEVRPGESLPGGFVGSATITSGSGQYVTAVMRSITNEPSSDKKTLASYSTTQETADRFHFPSVSSGSAAGAGMFSTLTAQNVDATRTITVVTTLNRNDGATTVLTNTIVPRGSLVFDVAQLAGNDFQGSAEILWPWPSETGWSGGFPLLAVGRTLDDPHTTGVAYMGETAHSFDWAVTPYAPAQMLEGLLANNWAGALGWSYYDGGTGVWDDYVAASQQFAAAHADIINIGGCQFNFSDVHASDYFYEPLKSLYCGGVVSGYSDHTFRPFANATRGQLAKIVTLSEGWPINTNGGPHFNDVTSANAFYGFVETAYSHGVISGYGDGTFKPYNNVTRGQLSKIIVLSSGWSTSNVTAQTFSDVSPDNAFYAFIETAYTRGLISGYSNGTFGWGNNATRGQIGKIVFLAGQQ